MPTKISASPVQPVVSQSAQYPVRGGVATPVYVYTSLPVGQHQVAGRALPVRFISASDLVENGGKYRLAAATTAMPVIAVSGVGYGAQGGAAIPVYDVTNLNYPPNVVIPAPPASGFPVLPSTTYLLALRANNLVLGALTTWLDESGLAHDFTRGAGSSGLSVASVGGYKTVQFNGVDDWMLGSDFADSLASMAIFAVYQSLGANGVLLAKYDGNVPAGWFMDTSGGAVGSELFWENGSDYRWVDIDDDSPIHASTVLVDCQKSDNASALWFINGLPVSISTSAYTPTPTSYSSITPVSIGNDAANSFGFAHMNLRSLVICSPVPSAPDAATLRTFLAAQGGVTL